LPSGQLKRLECPRPARSVDDNFAVRRGSIEQVEASVLAGFSQPFAQRFSEAALGVEVFGRASAEDDGVTERSELATEDLTHRARTEDCEVHGSKRMMNDE